MDVIFYLLNATSRYERYVYACKVLEKAYRQGYCCYVKTESVEQTQKLDELLWTFRSTSFLPHDCYDVQTLPHPMNKILLGIHEPPEMWQTLIINFAPNCPMQTSKTERVIEILENNPTVRESGRARFAHYHQRLGQKPKVYNV